MSKINPVKKNLTISEIDYSNDDNFVKLKQQTSYTELLKFSGFDCTDFGCEIERCILNVEYNHRYKRLSRPRLTIGRNNKNEIILVCRDFET